MSSITEIEHAVEKLSIAERILLVEDIWDSISKNSESIPLTAAQRLELDRRIDDFERYPNDGRPWDTVKDDLKRHK
jgi:putative addiction module component (TIGR02574 family)